MPGVFLKRLTIAFAAWLTLLAVLSACAPAVPVAPSPPPAIPEPLAPTEAYAVLMTSATGPRSLEKLVSLSSREDGAGYHARVLLGKRYLAEGDLSQAIALYHSALDMRKLAEPRQVAPERDVLISLLEATGDLDGQYGEWMRALPDPRAVAALTRLSKDRADRAALASVLISRYLYKDALLVLADDRSVEARRERARALAGVGRLNDAVREIEPYVRQNDGDPQAHLDYANLLERAGKSSLAIKEYRAAGASGLMGLGRVLQTAGRKDEALLAYLDSGQPEATRRAGLLLEELGEPLRAILVYASATGQNAAAVQECAIRGLLLCDRTGDDTKREDLMAMLGPGAAWLRGFDKPPLLETVASVPVEPEAVRTSKKLIATYGKDGEAMALIHAEIALVHADGDDAAAIAAYITTLGEPRVSVRAGGELIKSGRTRQVYQLLFPLAFRDTVFAIAKEYDIDPLLVMAVIREESAFDPAVTSRAGAIGLMQLMPATGKELGARLGVKVATGDLTSPALNIRLGSYYLMRLLKDQGGDVPKALAAYNGGPSNIVRWSAAGGDRSRQRFLLNITYAETRGYVWRVIETWRIYHWLYE